MEEVFTLEALREVVKDMNKHVVSPRTIKTQAEADEMTRNDPTGKVWAVSEGYYTFSGGKLL